MAIWAKLVYRNQVIDLTQNEYSLHDFTPPKLARSVIYNYGSSTNPSGGRRISDKPLDRNISITVRVMGASDAQTHLAARRLADFLENSADPYAGLYLEYAPEVAIPYQPIYGQQVYRYQIKHGQAAISQESYMVKRTTARALLVELDLTIGPYAEGIQQEAILCQSHGGVCSDAIMGGGMVIPEPSTNRFRNCIFEHVTFGVYWDVGANCNLDANYQRDYILFGNASALINGSGGNGTLTQTFSTSPISYTISFFAKKQDGSAVTSSDVTVFYNGASQNTTYQAYPDGWYRCYATVVGDATNRTYGCQVANGKSVYVDMFQCEPKAYYTYPFYGAEPGCVAEGLHISPEGTDRLGYTNYLALGRATSDETMEITIRMIVRWHHASDFQNDRYLFRSTANTNLTAYFRASDDKILFGSLSTSAQSFSANSVQVYYFTLSPSSRAIYINGAEAATGSGVAQVVINQVEIGGFSGTSYGNFTLLDLTVWNRQASSSQVQSDYNNISKFLASDVYGMPITPPPWASMYGSSVSNYYGATNRDWIVVGNVPGNHPAKTLLNYRNTSAVSKPLLVGLLSTIKPFYMPDLFKDLSGSADGAALGGAALVVSLGTTETALPAASPLAIIYDRDEIIGKNLYVAFSCKVATAPALVDARIKITTSGGNWAGYSEYQTLSCDTSYKTFLVGPLSLAEIYGDTPWQFPASIRVQLSVKRQSGTANFSLDYYRAFVGQIAAISNTGAITQFILRDGGAKGYTATDMIAIVEYLGERLDLRPGRYNYISSWYQGRNAATDFTPVLLPTVYITPRWSLV